MFIQDILISWWQTLRVFKPSELRVAGLIILNTVWQAIKTVIRNFLWVPLLLLATLLALLRIYVFANALLIKAGLPLYIFMLVLTALLGCAFVIFPILVMRPSVSNKDIKYLIKNMIHPALITIFLIKVIFNVLFVYVGLRPTAFSEFSPLMILFAFWLYDTSWGLKEYERALGHGLKMCWYNLPYFTVIFLLYIALNGLLLSFSAYNQSHIGGFLAVAIHLILLVGNWMLAWMYIAAIMYGYIKFLRENMGRYYDEA